MQEHDVNSCALSGVIAVVKLTRDLFDLNGLFQLGAALMPDHPVHPSCREMATHRYILALLSQAPKKRTQAAQPAAHHSVTQTSIGMCKDARSIY